MSEESGVYRELKFTVRDGLRLYGRHYPARVPSSRRPVLCLAGLTRNSRDFGRIATALSRHTSTPRDVYTLNSRGRGSSEYDSDWRNYSVPTEMHDVIDFMTMTELNEAGIIGTSRGGLITLVLAAAQPGRIGAAVLNDIGPVVETQGLMRIAGYVGKMPLPKSWRDAARAVLELSKRDFPESRRRRSGGTSRASSSTKRTASPRPATTASYRAASRFSTGPCRSSGRSSRP